MKPRTAYGAALLVLILVAGLTASAQVRQPMLRVDIPFDFIAGGNHLPAGQYLLSHPGHPEQVLLQAENRRAQALIFVHVSEAKRNPGDNKLVFNKYGDRYFLSQIRTAHDRELHEAYKSKSEQMMAAKFGKPEAINVVAQQ
jgi:hypothetical protein